MMVRERYFSKPDQKLGGHRASQLLREAISQCRGDHE